MENVKELCERQLATCQQLVEKYPKVELLGKALSAVQSSLDQLSSSFDKASSEGKVLKAILSNFTQSCLDSTYHQECQLVDKEFPDHTSIVEIRQIIETLSRPLTLCQLMGSEVSQLGTEVIECLHWRVGALLYMYSHMVLTVEERKKKVDVEHFKEALCVGVGHLNLMLCTRAPLSKDEEYVSHDATVPALLERGIFSDLHMLSLMYAGEMCHWYWELDSTLMSQPDAPSTPHTQPNIPSTPHAQPNVPSTSHTQPNTSPPAASLNTECGSRDTHTSQDPADSLVETAATNKTEESSASVAPTDKEGASTVSSKSEPSLWIVMELTQGVEFAKQWLVNFDPQKFGIEFLSKYIDVARGPLKEQSWSYTKAVQLLVSLRKAAALKH